MAPLPGPLLPRRGSVIKKFGELGLEELLDFEFAGGLGVGIELAEEAEDLIGFEVNAFDLIILAATFDGGPFDDAGRGRAERVAHVGLLIDFVGTGTGLAIGDELIGCKVSASGAVDDVEKAEFDGVGHGDLEIQVPRGVDG